MLNRVEVEGYKSIEKQTIELGALNVLIGANGSGKSNVLSVFDFVGAVVRGDLGSHVAQAGGAARILRASRQEQEMSLKFAFDPNEYRIVFRQGVAGELVVANESAAFQGKGFEEPFRINISKGSLESRLGDLADARGKATAKWVHSEMASWKRFHFHDTMPTADVRAYARVDDNHELRRNGEIAILLTRVLIFSHAPTAPPRHSAAHRGAPERPRACL